MYCKVLYCTIVYLTIRTYLFILLSENNALNRHYGPTQYITIQYNTLQYNTLQYKILNLFAKILNLLHGGLQNRRGLFGIILKLFLNMSINPY